MEEVEFRRVQPGFLQQNGVEVTLQKLTNNEVELADEEYNWLYEHYKHAYMAAIDAGGRKAYQGLLAYLNAAIDCNLELPPDADIEIGASYYVPEEWGPLLQKLIQERGQSDMVINYGGYGGTYKSPLELLQASGNIPTMQLGGAMRPPSYFDFNQPGGYIPPGYGYQQPPQYQIPPVAPTTSPLNQRLYEAKYGQQQPPPQYNRYQSAYQDTGYIPRNARDINCYAIEDAPPPYSITAVPGNIGAVYSDVAYRQRMGVNDNFYDPRPSSSFMDRMSHSPLSGYSNPYMGGFYKPASAEEIALHNYAIEYGFDSVAELKANDLSVLKTMSIIANSVIGRSEDEIKQRLEKVYGNYEEEQRSHNPTVSDIIKNHDRYESYKDRMCVHTVIQIIDSGTGEVIKEVDTRNRKFIGSRSVDNNTYWREIATAYANQLQRQAHSQYVHENALERKFDELGFVEFCNNAFYELHIRDLMSIEQSKRAQNLKKLYRQEDFKREVKKLYGRPGVRNRLMEEDLRFRKGDPVSKEGNSKGSYGMLPFNIPIQSNLDPRLGYCFEFDEELNDLVPQNPRTDEELMMIKNKFLRAAGCEVPLYAKMG